MQATRQRILDYLRRNNRATVKELAEATGLTATGIRQHLTVLQRDGLVAATEERGRVGRPALVYALSPIGDAMYPKRYDELANKIIDEVRAMAGPQGLQNLYHRVAARFAEPYRARVEGLSLDQRVGQAAAIMNERGCFSDTEKLDDGTWLLHLRACPVPNVACEHSGICGLEVDFVRLLTGADVHIARSMLRGDRACTYQLRLAEAKREEPSQ